MLESVKGSLVSRGGGLRLFVQSILWQLFTTATLTVIRHTRRQREVVGCCVAQYSVRKVLKAIFTYYSFSDQFNQTTYVLHNTALHIHK